MTNNKYKRGAHFEYKIKHLLEDNGFIVLRTAGSHGFADLVALRNGITYFLQLKYGKPATKKERLKFMKIAERHRCWFTEFLIVHGEPRKKPKWIEFNLTGKDEWSENWYEESNN